MTAQYSEINRNKILITERSLNYILRPVQARRCNFPYTYHVENLNQKVSVTVDRPWTYANHLLLDFIGHELFERLYKNIVEKRNTWKNEFSQSLLMSMDKLFEQKDAIITDDLKPYLQKYEEYIQAKEKEKELTELVYTSNADQDNELENIEEKIDLLSSEIGYERIQKFDDIRKKLSNGRMPYIVNIDLNKITDRYKEFFGNNRKREYLPELIKRTSEVNFSFEYPLQHPVEKTYQHQGESKTKIIGTRLETVEIEKNNIFDYELENNSLRVLFNSFLGKIYCHNILTFNTDWFEESFLKLNGLASAIYRRFFVTKSKKSIEFELPIKDMFEYFEWSKNSQYPKLVEKAFGDIKSAGLISDFKLIENSGKFSKGYIKVVKSSK